MESQQKHARHTPKQARVEFQKNDNTSPECSGSDTLHKIEWIIQENMGQTKTELFSELSGTGSRVYGEAYRSSLAKEQGRTVSRTRLDK